MPSSRIIHRTVTEIVDALQRGAARDTRPLNDQIFELVRVRFGGCSRETFMAYMAAVKTEWMRRAREKQTERAIPADAYAHERLIDPRERDDEEKPPFVRKRVR